MPSSNGMPTTMKSRSAIVRQLSLQSQNQVKERTLRRQASADNKNLTEEVRVTGRGWNTEKTGPEKPDPGIRIGPTDGGKVTAGKSTVTRPRAARMAWAEKRSESSESHLGVGVAVVAKKCQGLQRPALRMSRQPSVPFAHESPLVLSRQQLAERLRRAWRTREQQNNLEIYLAHNRTNEPNTPKSYRGPIRGEHPHNVETSRTDSSISSSKSIKTPKKVIKSENTKKSLQDQSNKIEIDVTGVLTAEEDEEKEPKTPALANLLDFKMFPVQEATKKFGTDYSSRQFQVASMSLANTMSFDAADKENVPGNLGDRNRLNGMSASARRASFRSSQLFSKAVTGSGSDEEADFAVECAARPTLMRASSAPTPRPSSPLKKSHRAKSPKDSNKSLRNIPSPGGSIKSNNGDEENLKKANCNLEKKQKTHSGRRKAKDRKTRDGDSSDEEPTEARTKPQRRRQPARTQNCGEVITMVSLVSPAESDVEEPPTPSVSSWAEANEKSTENRLDQCQGLGEKNGQQTPLVFTLFPKKGNKTVSFQSHPPMNRSYSANFPIRRASPGASIIVSTSQPPVQPNNMHRQDNQRGVKRRLIRSSTTISKEDDDNNSSDDASKTDTSTESAVHHPQRHRQAVNGNCKENNKESSDLEEEEEDEDKKEPELKTPKERECWALYKRMLDKGVTVSYDTVLRGMLTPTEYRLRQSQQQSRS